MRKLFWISAARLALCRTTDGPTNRWNLSSLSLRNWSRAKASRRSSWATWWDSDGGGHFARNTTLSRSSTSRTTTTTNPARIRTTTTIARRQARPLPLRPALPTITTFHPRHPTSWSQRICRNLLKKRCPSVVGITWRWPLPPRQQRRRPLSVASTTTTSTWARRFRSVMRPFFSNNSDKTIAIIWGVGRTASTTTTETIAIRSRRICRFIEADFSFLTRHFWITFSCLSQNKEKKEFESNVLFPIPTKNTSSIFDNVYKFSRVEFPCIWVTLCLNYRSKTFVFVFSFVELNNIFFKWHLSGYHGEVTYQWEKEYRRVVIIKKRR